MNSKLLGLGLLAAAIATPASALTFVQDVNVDNRFGGYFNAFDSALGTLTKVTVEATVSDERGAAAHWFMPASGQFALNVTGAVGSSLTDLIHYSGSSGLVTLNPSSPFLSATGTGSGLFEYSGDALSRFLGTGAKFINIDEAELAHVSYQTPAGFAGYLQDMSDPAGISIAHRITYEYSAPGQPLPGVESAVPEPASWAMMIVGFGVVGHALRRSKRSRRLVQAA